MKTTKPEKQGVYRIGAEREAHDTIHRFPFPLTLN